MYKLGIIIGAISLLIGCTAKQVQEEKPNLLIIQTDEHNFRTLGCYRELLDEARAYPWGKDIKVETPNLDRIAHEGAICTKYYASSPVCTPSRASFQTGLYPIATGAPINGMTMNKDITTFATVLSKAGYETNYVGKWHLYGHRPDSVSVEDHETAYGYTDYSWRFEGGHAKWVIADYEKKDYTVSYAEPKVKVDSLYITDFLTNRALELLERDKNKPFCLMVSLPNPHSPDIAREPYKSQYADLAVQSPETMKPELVEQRPGWGVGGKGEAGDFKEQSVREYFGMVKCIDDNVGRMLKFLDDNSLAEKTIVLFTSDHGDLLFEHKRVNKDQPYESSAKVPFIIRYPNKIKSGKVINDCYTTCDFAPTILGMMNQSQIPNVHGIDASATFLNDEIVTNSGRAVYITDSPFSEWAALTDGRYKLVLSCKDTPWLLDLEKDPDELVNFYSEPEYAEIAAKMQKQLITDMETYRDPSLALGIKYLYSADDTVTYKGPYYQKDFTDIRKLEKETLKQYINDIKEKCYN